MPNAVSYGKHLSIRFQRIKGTHAVYWFTYFEKKKKEKSHCLSVKCPFRVEAVNNFKPGCFKIGTVQRSVALLGEGLWLVQRRKWRERKNDQFVGLFRIVIEFHSLSRSFTENIEILISKACFRFLLYIWRSANMFWNTYLGTFSNQNRNIIFPNLSLFSVYSLLLGPKVNAKFNNRQTHMKLNMPYLRNLLFGIKLRIVLHNQF